MGICSRKNKNEMKSLLKGAVIKSLSSGSQQLGWEQGISKGCCQCNAPKDLPVWEMLP